MKIIPLTAGLAQQHRAELARLYFENVRSNACHGRYTFDEAYAKIGALIDHLEDGTAISYRLFDEDEIHGFIWAYVHQFREEKRMYVSEIRVGEAYRNQGFGTALLELVEVRAAELGLDAVYLHAEANNPEALRFYAAHGYSTERVQLRKAIS